MLPSSGKEAPNLVNPLDQGIQSHSIEGVIRIGASLPEDRCKAGIRNVVFVFKKLDNGCSPKKRMFDFRFFLLSLSGIIISPHFQLTLRYKSEGRGFDSRWCRWNFSLT